MRKAIPIIVLSTFGLLALAISLRGLFAPASLGASLGYMLVGTDGLNEVRAQYGGFFLAIATLCGLAVLRSRWREPALVLLAVTFGGILFGRITSIAIDGGVSAYGPVIHALVLIDLIGMLAAGAALALSRGEVVRL
jgi:hypothetical protein